MSEEKQKSTDIEEKIRVAWAIVLKGAYGEFIRKDLEYYAQRQSHTPGDPCETAFRDGQRIMAQNILLTASEDK